MNVNTKFEGFAELERKLNRLPTAASKKVMRGALMAALTPMVKRARELVRKNTGALAKSIKKRSVINRASDFNAVAGIYMATRKGQEGWRWHFEEFGTSKQEAHPFLRPAFDEKKDEAVARFKAELAKRIEKEARKK